MYLVPKAHNRLAIVRGGLVLSNCYMPCEKATGFLDHHLQPNLRSGMSHIKDTNSFLSKIKNLQKFLTMLY